MNWNELFLEIEPVAKGRPRTAPSGHVYTPEKTRTFERDVAILLKSLWKKTPLLGPIKLELEFFLRPPKKAKNVYPLVKPDYDNLCKSISDAANGILWQDDKQIVDCHAVKIYDLIERRVGIRMRFKLIEN